MISVIALTATPECARLVGSVAALHEDGSVTFTAASTMDEALDVCRHTTLVAGVVVDATMPGLGHALLADQLVDADPASPVCVLAPPRPAASSRMLWKKRKATIIAFHDARALGALDAWAVKTIPYLDDSVRIDFAWMKRHRDATVLGLDAPVLTETQAVVCSLLTLGYTPRAIARETGLATPTVWRALHEVCAATGARNLFHLAAGLDFGV